MIKTILLPVLFIILTLSVFAIPPVVGSKTNIWYVDLQTDTPFGDFRLAPGSPVVDTGCDTLIKSTDVSGNKRPEGRAINRGCYEQ